MRKEQIIGLAVRLFAVFLAVYTIRYASGLLPRVALQPPNNVSLLYIFSVALFPILAAVLLWFFPLSVAAKIIPETKSKKQVTSLSPAEIEVVAFSVMGLWVLAGAIPDTLNWATYFALWLANHEAFNLELTPDNIGNMVGTIAELVIGFWLMFGSHGLLVIIRRARHAGR